MKHSAWHYVNFKSGAFINKLSAQLSCVFFKVLNSLCVLNLTSWFYNSV